MFQVLLVQDVWKIVLYSLL